ncbi:MAG: NUDIX domain-containing protein [Desulforhopalus sp.]
MITVTAAIIEKNGRILAARRKSGSHLAGFWEFPGGKLEQGETEEECLARELLEEFDITCIVGNFFGESVYDYGSKVIRLLGYHVRHVSGSFYCRDHDRIAWLPVHELQSLKWAPADIPLVRQLQKEEQIRSTLAYYRDNAPDYVRETIAFECHNDLRQHFVNLLAPNSLILDLGCGSGRDSRYFLDQGHRVLATDAVSEIADCAAQYIGQPVRVQLAEELAEVETYDAVWASASLPHIPRSRIIDTFRRIIDALKPGGIWYMSFKKGETECQDRKLRFYNNYTIPLMHRLLSRFPQIKVLEISESSSQLRGKDQVWINTLLTKKPAIDSPYRIIQKRR